METLYSHPDKPLQDHLRRVLDTGIGLFNHKQGLNLPYPRADTEQLLKYVLIFHDAGKMTRYFQAYLGKEEGHELLKHKGLTDHGLVSALICAFQVYRFFETNPHRMVYASMAFAAVRKHHGNLDNIGDILMVNRDDWKKVEQQLPYCDVAFFRTHFSEVKDIYDYGLQDLKQCFDDLDDLKWENFEESDIGQCSLENYFYMNFLYSLLLFSDKHEAIFSQEGQVYRPQIPGDIVDRFKERNFKDGDSPLNRRRDRIYQDIACSIRGVGTSGRIFSINVPTGSGKTLCSLNAALKLRDQTHMRIIYCLPFTSVIDQNAEVFESILAVDFSTVSSRLLVKHHHLVENRWTDEVNEYTGDKGEFMIETWNGELVVTTFWQFFHTLFSNKNSQLKKFHNMAGSIVLLDEIQAIPVKYWTLLKEALETFVRMFNCKVVLVTATMPMIFSEARGEIVELVPKKEEYFKSFNRIWLTVDPVKKELEEFAEELKRDIDPDKRYLIILNTIRTSLELYRRLEEFKPLYLSTNIIPKHRLERIRHIKKKNRGDILVSTQLVEAGVDIDFDVVYRDSAPLDSINQGAGRCNRENRMDRPGEVILVHIVNNGKSYASYIYDQLLLNATTGILQGESRVPESRFFDISRRYFDHISKIMSRQPSAELLRDIRQLKYRDAFAGENAFRLIDNSFQRENVFVQVDEDARRIWDWYQEIKGIRDRWERKNEFNKIKNHFSQYVISVSRDSLKKNTPPEDNGFYFIPMGQLNEFYHLDTGFKTEGGLAIW